MRIWLAPSGITRVVAEAAARGFEPLRPSEVHERPGLGVRSSMATKQHSEGRHSLRRWAWRSMARMWTSRRSGSGAVRIRLGWFVLRDQPRPEARLAIDAMRDLGIQRIILLTGDRAAAAREIGDALGIDGVISEVLPSDKFDVVRAQQAAGRVVMMVGDGVNDAPVLRGADVGVALAPS